jgi:protein required for attachment to host cells
LLVFQSLVLPSLESICGNATLPGQTTSKVAKPIPQPSPIADCSQRNRRAVCALKQITTGGKMNDFQLNHKAHLLVCDGTKALILRNDGSAPAPQLIVEREFHADIPSRTSEMGTDRPGRTSNSASRSSSIEQTDFHTQEEEAFLKNVVTEFDAHCRDNNVRQIAIAAPARALAVVRGFASKDLMSRCVGQIAKDYVNHPVPEISRLIAL